MKLTLATTIMLAALSKEAAAQEKAGANDICLLTCPDPAKPFMNPGCVARRFERHFELEPLTCLFSPTYPIAFLQKNV
jgi:hypothetical protein